VAGTSAGEAPSASAAAVAGQAAGAPLFAGAQAYPGWSPYAAAGTPGSSPRSSARLSTQPEPRRAMVWLGSGLVGVAGAAGLVLFRLRNP
jgi:hypothetical protein